MALVCFARMGPLVEYARSGDVQVAYQITGDGPEDLVWAPGTVSHLDLDWDWPAKARFIEQLSSFCRLIRFDKRGTGLSDRPMAAATLEERMDDIRAVMDAASSERAHLFGVSEGANLACLFAATYPNRTRSLIVWGGQARWIKSDDYPWGMTPAESDAMVERLRSDGVGLWYIVGPGAGTGAADDAFLDWFLRYARAGGSPAAFAALEAMNAQIDIRDILPTIRVPTLVLNRTGDPVANVDAARDLAARIPGARFVEFPGQTHQLTGDPDPVLAEIRSFVTGAPAPLATSRQFATILFADIAGSTARLSELGDRAWRDLLEHYYTSADQELERHQGREIDRAGDGLFALFDGPTRAIRCALALRAMAERLGLGLRQGLHAGEVEVAPDEVRGIAVHFAARIGAIADAGEIIVSGTLRDIVAGSGLAFDDRGERELKGVPERRRLFAVVG